MTVFNSNIAVMKCVGEDHAGPVLVHAIAMDGPDEGPFLINSTVDSVEKAMQMAESLDPQPWPMAVVVIMHPQVQQARA